MENTRARARVRPDDLSRDDLYACVRKVRHLYTTTRVDANGKILD